MKNRLFIYEVTWHNGFYNVSTDIVATSEEQAVSEAVRIYGGQKHRTRPDCRDLMDCGLRGEPLAKLSIKNVTKSNE